MIKVSYYYILFKSQKHPGSRKDNNNNFSDSHYKIINILARMNLRCLLDQPLILKIWKPTSSLFFI